MPEVTGKTAVLFDPSSKQSIGQALHDMLANLDLCQKLGEAALHRSRGFRWDATARTVLNVYREVASVPSRAVESSAPRALASGS